MTGMPEPLEYGTFVAPPFYGTGEMLTWQTNVLFESIDKKRLYTEFWQKGKTPEESSNEILENESEAKQNALEIEILTENLVNARGYYSFFPVITDGNQLILLSPNDYQSEIAQFQFPPPENSRKYCLADYFRPEMDILSVQIVTIGAELGNFCSKYDKKKDLKGYHLDCVGKYIVEIVADKLTNEIRRSLFLNKDQGLRYSFGEEGMPGLPEQEKILELLCAEDRLDIILSEDFYLLPDHSSLGMFIHHPGINNLK